MHHLSDKVYTQFYDVDAWIEPLRECGKPAVTPYSKFVPLHCEDLEALLMACEQVAAAERGGKVGGSTESVWNFLSSSPQAAELNRLATRTEAAIQQLSLRHEGIASLPAEKKSLGAFVKLSTRSPKDSSLLEKRRALLSKQDAACEGAPMRVITGEEAIALLITSQRIRDDLHEALLLLREPGGESLTKSTLQAQMSIVVREWWHVPRWTEMRGFVRRTDEKRHWLTALSRYNINEEVASVGRGSSRVSASSDEKVAWPEEGILADNADTIRAAVVDFVQHRLSLVLTRAGLDHAVVDFGLRASPNGVVALQVPAGTASAMQRFDIVVLELNSFGFRSSGALFDWRDEKDAEILFDGCPTGGPAPFRTTPPKRIP